MVENPLTAICHPLHDLKRGNSVMTYLRGKKYASLIGGGLGFSVCVASSLFLEFGFVLYNLVIVGGFGWLVGLLIGGVVASYRLKIRGALAVGGLIGGIVFTFVAYLISRDHLIEATFIVLGAVIVFGGVGILIVIFCE